MANINYKSLILNQIKLHYDIKRDTDFAEFLGVSQPTMAAWRKRNTFDAELIITKCPDIDANWLLTGKGEMLKKNTYQENTTQTNVIAAEPEEQYGTKPSNQDTSKDKIIETQQKLIKSLEKNIELLEFQIITMKELATDQKNSRKAG